MTCRAKILSGPPCITNSMSSKMANRSPTRALSSAIEPEKYQWRTQVREGLPMDQPVPGAQEVPGGSGAIAGSGQCPKSPSAGAGHRT
eukprot:scaffold243938_cov30-Tisochrysis_lutea.AAC.2